MWKFGVVTGQVRAPDGKPLRGRIVQLFNETSNTYGGTRLSQVGTATTDDQGNYRISARPGRHFLALQSTSAAGASPWHPALLYPASYTLAGAQRITVTPGSETTLDLDFPSEVSRYVDVSGKVDVVTDGSVAGVIRLDLVNASELDAGGVNIPVSTAIVDPTGAFRFRAVPPGTYLINALTAERQNPQSPSRGTTYLAARTPVTVQDRPIGDLTVPLKPGVPISGRITFAGSGPHPSLEELSRSNERSRFAFEIQGLDAYGSIGNLIVGLQGMVASDGHFQTIPLPPGRYSFIVSVPTEDGLYWQATSQMVDGRESARTGVVLGEVPIQNVVMTLTKPASAVRGRITDIQGRPRSDVILYLASRDDRGRPSILSPSRNGDYVANLRGYSPAST